MDDFFERLNAGRPVIIDGGTGSEMEKRGAKMEEKGWSASCTLTAPNLLRAIHEDYIRAGAEVIIANTFSTSKHVLEQCGIGHQFEEMNATAVRIALESRDNVAQRPVWVAGSISTTTFAPDSHVDTATLQTNWEHQAEILAESGIDFFMLEMMNHIEKTCIAYDAASKTGLPVIVGYNTHTDVAGEVQLGLLGSYHKDRGTLAEAIQALPDGVPMITIMHSLTTDIPASLDVIHANYSGPSGAYAHWGEFVMPNWQFNDMISAEAYADEAQKWVDAGVKLIGGCCGIGPDHIQELAKRFG